MHVNHRFLLNFALGNYPNGKSLDYGCGSGDLVRAGLAQGLDIYGCETFYGGAHGDIQGTADLMDHRVFAMRDGRIPFPPCTFDLIISNMVIEHVEDLDLMLSECRRVLKPGGCGLLLFPTREVWREGHCGVPFAHRFHGAYHWLLVGRCIGLGYFTAGKTRRQWARDFDSWLRSYCFYRPLKDIVAAMKSHGFMVQHCEREYMRFRGIRLLTPGLFRMFGFAAIEVATRESALAV